MGTLRDWLIAAFEELGGEGSPEEVIAAVRRNHRSESFSEIKLMLWAMVKDNLVIFTSPETMKLLK